MEPRRPSTLADVWPWLALTAGLAVLTLWMTRPLVEHPLTTIPGPSGDNLYFAWLLDWYQKGFAGLRLSASVPTLNVPEGWSLAYNEMTPALALLALPGRPAGVAFAYNLSFWLSFLLSGLFTAIWVFRLTGRVLPGFAAAIVFAFAPYRLSHSYGHLNLLGTQWLPLYFMCLSEMLRGGAIWWAVGAALAVVALAGTSQYYLYMTAVATIPFAFVVLRGTPRWHRETPAIRNLIVMSALALPIVALLVWPYLALAREGAIAPHALSDVRGWSASPTDFVLPSRVHWLAGDWMTDRFKAEAWVERTVNVGLVSIVLALVGWWTMRRDAKQGSIVRACAAGALAAFVLALGVELHWLGQVVQLPVPKIARIWLQTDVLQTSVPLPGYLLFKYFPFYASMRVWMRWGIYVSLFLGVLAGLGFHHATMHRSRGARLSWACAVALLVLMEFAQKPLPVTRVEGRAVDRWLAARPGDRGDVVAELPVDNLGSPQATFYTMYHGHPFTGAFFSAFPSPQFRRIGPALKGFPDSASVNTMKEIGVRWVVVDLARYDHPEEVRDRARAFGAITDVDPHMVLELR